jgi:hypothetical protein
MRLSLKISISACLFLAILFSTGLSLSIYQVKKETLEMDALVRDFLSKCSQSYVAIASKNFSPAYQKKMSIPRLKSLITPLKNIKFKAENTKRIFFQAQLKNDPNIAYLIYEYQKTTTHFKLFFTLKKNDMSWEIDSFSIKIAD